MLKHLIAGAALALTALAASVPAQATGKSLESQLITGFEPFTPPNDDIRMEDGSTVTLQDFPGELVLATVWFTTCPNCQIEMPQLADLQGVLKEQGLADKIRLLPVSIDEVVFRETPADAMERVRTYYKRKKLDGLPIALDLRGRNASKFFSPDPVGTPTTFFISPTGDVVAVLQGSLVDWTAPESIAYLRSLAGV